jgi:hypothetical protein
MPDSCTFWFINVIISVFEFISKSFSSKYRFEFFFYINFRGLAENEMFVDFFVEHGISCFDGTNENHQNRYSTNN